MRIPLFLHKFASPRYFYAMSGKLLPWTMGLFAAVVMIGLYIGLLLAPTHSEQGESYRIIFVHVPAASNSLMVYMVMATSGIIFLVWRIKLADVIAAASAPVGASFTLLALVTGSIWGKPTWGTWWQWDARLTSELILLFLYLGYMALRAAIEDRQNAARASAVLAIVGMVNIPIIHYSVEWWNTLHQGATITKLATPSIENTMLSALLLMMTGLVLFYATTVLERARCYVLRNEIRSGWVRDLPRQGGRLWAWLLPALALAAIVGHWASTPRERVATPSEVLAQTNSGGGDIIVQGTVESLMRNEDHSQFVLSDGQSRITVRFPGQLPQQFRTDWGARVEGRPGADRAVFEARTVAALNVRDHSAYVLGAYLIALVIFSANLISPFHCHRQARQAVARRIRREEKPQ